MILLTDALVRWRLAGRMRTPEIRGRIPVRAVWLGDEPPKTRKGRVSASERSRQLDTNRLLKNRRFSPRELQAEREGFEIIAHVPFVLRASKHDNISFSSLLGFTTAAPAVGC